MDLNLKILSTCTQWTLCRLKIFRITSLPSHLRETHSWLYVRASHKASTMLPKRQHGRFGISSLAVARKVYVDVPVHVDQPFEQLVHSTRDVHVPVSSSARLAISSADRKLLRCHSACAQLDSRGACILRGAARHAHDAAAHDAAAHDAAAHDAADDADDGLDDGHGWHGHGWHGHGWHGRVLLRIPLLRSWAIGAPEQMNLQRIPSIFIT